MNNQNNVVRNNIFSQTKEITRSASKPVTSALELKSRIKSATPSFVRIDLDERDNSFMQTEVELNENYKSRKLFEDHINKLYKDHSQQNLYYSTYGPKKTNKDTPPGVKTPLEDFWDELCEQDNRLVTEVKLEP